LNSAAVWHNKGMSVICPTITTGDPHVYREQLEIIASYTDGVHLDFSDGIFAPSELLPIDEAWRSDDLITHAHIMYQKPLEVIDDIIHLEADLVILHAESDDVKKCLQALRENGTRTGIALLPETSVSDLQELEIDDLFDHVLIFGGHLGFQGSDADLDQLDKVTRIRKAYPDIEIAWDGGVNDKNAKQISDSGVSVLNVGGFLHNAESPKTVYDTLVSLVS
jgi:ribulose-phosphate 3-epimerase